MNPLILLYRHIKNNSMSKFIYSHPIFFLIFKNISFFSCIMDNNAMFAAQQNAVYGKMYGSLDATGR